MTTTRITADRSAAGERLDRLLAREVPGMSLERARKLIEAGSVRIRGKACKPLRKLWGGEEIEIELGSPAKPALPAPEASAPPLRILHEDALLVIVDKPAGITVEPEGNMPSIVGRVAAQVENLDVGGQALPGVAHRLDRDTTGCLALAKTDEGLGFLKAAFEGKRARKAYWAIVLGEPPPSQRLEAPYGRDPRDPRRYSTRVQSARRAALSYRVVERFAGAALVEVELETGRTHQIRVQLSEAGFPLLGDAVYGSEASRSHPAALAVGRQALHARSLVLIEPGGARLSVEAPVPEDLQRGLELLRGAARSR